MARFVLSNVLPQEPGASRGDHRGSHVINQERPGPNFAYDSGLGSENESTVRSSA
jgi:hypothetical protein